MFDEKERAEQAKTYIRMLSQEIGPRPAGSQSETLARDTVCGYLESWGYICDRQDFSFAPLSVFPWLSVFTCLLLIVFCWVFPVIPEITIFLPVVYLFMPSLVRLETRCRPKTEKSTNLFCLHASQKEVDLPLLIITAHIDTARAFVTTHPILLSIYSKYMTILQRAAFLIAILSFFILFNFKIPVFLYWIVGGVCTVTGLFFLIVDFFNHFSRPQKYSPGAVDNASGVAVAMSLAHFFAEYPPKRLRLGFLFSSAEETGMHGADAFARRIAKERRTAGVLNLDMVGAGQELCVVTQAGFFFTKKTDGLFNQLLLDIDPSLQRVRYTIRGGDFEPFINQRIPATSLETRGAQGADLAYHTVLDTFEKIETPSLEMVLKIVFQFIERLPYSNWSVRRK